MIRVRRMSNPLRTAEDYEIFLYTLQERYEQSATPVSSSYEREQRWHAWRCILFDQEIRLVVRERILLDKQPTLIDEYGYETWRGNVKLYWYDFSRIPAIPR